MKVLITGASGYLGQQLVRQLIYEGHDVVCLDRRTAKSGGQPIVVCDLTKRGYWETRFRDVEVVFHLAGKVHALAETMQDESEYMQANVEGTRNVLVAAKAYGVRRFVFFSSVKAMSRDDMEFGSTPERPLDETDLVVPDTSYGRSKRAAEELVLRGGFVSEPVVLRLSMVYGPGASGNLQRMLEAVRRRRFPLLPDVQNRRSMVHAADVLATAMLAMTHSAAVGNVFIVSDGKAYSTREILASTYRVLGREMPRWSVPLWLLRLLGRVGDAVGKIRGRRVAIDSESLAKLLGSAWFSSAKLYEELGFRPRWDLESALPTMLSGSGAVETQVSVDIQKQ